MLRFLPGTLRAIIASLLLVLNTACLAVIILIISIFYFIIPIPKWRLAIKRFLHGFPEIWTDINDFILGLTTKTKWEIHGVENLKKRDWYLIIANHQSWLDILVLQKVFNRKIPSLRYFMKKELLWQLPLAAQACLILDYPFMKRYSKDFLKKHPHLKGKDVETTRKTCEKFKNIPISIINFVEGHRFTQERHERQNSPYKYLLKPKAGGIAFTLGAMGDILNTLLNVTIIYPDKNNSIWDFLCGRVDKIQVYVKAQPIEDSCLGNYEKDRHFRSEFQKWLNKLWQEKNDLINTVKHTCQNNKEVANATPDLNLKSGVINQ